MPNPPLMRAVALVALLTFSMTLPAVSAEWGEYGEDGWPLAVDGSSTRPPGIDAIDWFGVTPDWQDDAMNAPLNEVAGNTVYPYWPILTAEVQRLALDHPDLVKVHSAGKSTLGLDLWMLEIADFGNADMVPLDQREVVWVDGGTHSNEYSGVYFVTHLASFLLDEYGTNDTATWIVENRHTWLMPMVNPDGSNAFGRLNANLVNINRNYPVIWDGSGHDELMNNRGPEPASEVETQINIEWFEKVQPDYYASVHCCGNLWLYPYGEEGLDPLDNTTLARVCEEAFPTVREDCGPIWSTIYPASGSSVDTVYEYTGAVAFGYEMSGRGAISLWGQPFTMDTVRTQEVESWEGVLHAFLNVHRYGGYPVIETEGVTRGGMILGLVNEGYGPILGGVFRVTDVDTGQVFEVELPVIEPGGTAEVRVEVPTEYATWETELTYQKRIAAAPNETKPLGYVLVEKAGNSGWHVHRAPTLELLHERHAASETEASLESTPALPGLVVAAALVLGLALRRRRA